MTRYIIEQSGQFYWELHQEPRITIKQDIAFASVEDAKEASAEWLKSLGQAIVKTHVIKPEQYSGTWA